MTITVGQLKEALEDYDDDLEVRFASQPNWPFEYSIRRFLVERLQLVEDDEEAAQAMISFDEERDGPGAPKNCVFLVEGHQICYASKKIWDHV